MAWNTPVKDLDPDQGLITLADGSTVKADVVIEVKVWDLQDIDPLPTWIRGRAILIGDAAHAMSPLQGQGANMAIEDAEGMRLFLQPGVQVEDVPHILKQIDAVRRPRAAQVLGNTRAANKEASLEDRFMTAMDANFSYSGILDALNQESRV
ncbi:putative fad binding domain protein [Neofusicoccum parvum UCRNP2]|uniref:Putative fad binding domain protein n=1 Tax=Botryosphaeria parva (strain UCR-NP2) TaxID=1287680 RepID=R1EFA2_BOTPV|nr:putative fad binding domain protein [Neofusicoccum parvum UCRNP2]